MWGGGGGGGVGWVVGGGGGGGGGGINRCIGMVNGVLGLVRYSVASIAGARAVI